MTVFIVTRDAAFFEKLRLAAGVAGISVPELRITEQWPEKTEYGVPVIADMSGPGRCLETVPPEADAVFVDARNVETFGGVRAVFKYAPVDRTLAEIGGILRKKNGTTGKSEENPCRIVCFCAPAGGSGATSVAAAAAMAAAPGAFYLSLEPCPGTDLFPAAQGENDLSDVLFALGNRHASPESVAAMAAEDPDGVSVLRSPRLPADTAGWTPEAARKLLRTLAECGRYSYIAVDCPFSFGGTEAAAMELADETVLVRTPSEASREKTEKARTVLTEKSRAVTVLVNRENGVAENAFPDYGTVGTDVLLRKMAARLSELRPKWLGGNT